MKVVTPEFQSELTALINRHSIENIGNIPDFMLARFLCEMIEQVGHMTSLRDQWFDINPGFPVEGKDVVLKIEN